MSPEKKKEERVMANVSKTTRAGKHGKKIRCPTCEADTTVYHFAWSALVCSTCKTAHEKHSWKETTDEPAYKNGYDQEDLEGNPQPQTLGE